MRLDYDITLATPDDIPGMLALQDANLPDKGGSLSVRLTEDWFRDTILEKSIVVGRCNSTVIGYVMRPAAFNSSDLTKLSLRIGAVTSR